MWALVAITGGSVKLRLVGRGAALGRGGDTFSTLRWFRARSLLEIHGIGLLWVPKRKQILTYNEYKGQSVETLSSGNSID